MKGSCVVIGGGVIGLSCARNLCIKGYNVILIEATNRIGSITSSRNSEVIHAGIYYTNGSQKAKMCVKGRRMLYDYLATKNITHKKCGKIIVATNADEHAKLVTIQTNARNNGVDLYELTAVDMKRKESEISGISGLWSPETGIFDSHAYMEHLLNDCEANGFSIVYNCIVQSFHTQPYHKSYNTSITPTTSLTATPDRGNRPLFQVTTNQGTIEANYIINAAGLNALHIASSVNIHESHIANKYYTRLPPYMYYCKGNYFKLNKSSSSSFPNHSTLCDSIHTSMNMNINNMTSSSLSSLSFQPFQHLIYPVPSSQAGLGIHMTLDISGNIKFGPDIEWIKNIDNDMNTINSNSEGTGNSDNTRSTLYTHTNKLLTQRNDYSFLSHETVIPQYHVNENRKNQFYDAIERYWPNVRNFDLEPDYSGIRPKLVGPNTPKVDTFGRDLTDFYIEGSLEHGVKGLVNLIGIESPGLTSSLAIAEYVTNLVEND